MDDATHDLTSAMRWGPLDGGTWTRVDGRPTDQRIAFTSAPVGTVTFGTPVHLYVSHVVGGEWLYHGEIGWDGLTPVTDLRLAMTRRPASQRPESRTEGDA